MMSCYIYIFHFTCFRPPGKPPKWDKNKQYFPPPDNSIDKVDMNSEKVFKLLRKVFNHARFTVLKVFKSISIKQMRK